MNIEEMHIKVDMDLQKVSTYTQRNLLPQEIDFFLNDEVLKFIDQRNSSKSNVKGIKADGTVKRYEDLKDLTRYVDLDVQDNEDGTGTCILPDDYYEYIESKTNVYQLCKDEVIGSINKTLYKCVFPLSFPTGTTLTSYTITLNDSSGNTVIFDLTSLPSGYIANVDINKQKFMLKKGILILTPENLDNKQSNTYSFYWENFNEEFHNSSFILVSSEAFNNVVVNVNNNSNTYNSEQITYKTYNENLVLWGKNRLIEDEFEFEGMQSNLSSSRPDSPSVQLRQGVLQIDIPKNTICQKIKLKYISTPTILDLALGRNLNMNNKVAKEIVSNTIRFLKGVFQGDYNTYLNENVMIE